MTTPKKIPDKYKIKLNGCRSLSTEECSLHNIRIHDIRCPVCGVNALDAFPYPSDSSDFPVYQVTCDHCDWICPSEPLEDIGESIGLFKTWLAAYRLMGEPKDYVNVDCTLYFNPENDVELETISEISNNNENAIKGLIFSVVEHSMKIVGKDKMCSILESATNLVKENK